MKNTTCFFHVGYPKTATTTLQHYIFEDLRDDIFLSNHPPIKSIIDSICQDSDESFDENLEDHRRTLDSYQSSTSVIMSNEELTAMVPEFGGTPSTDLITRAERLQRLLSPFDWTLKFLITLRRQPDFIKSRFAAHYNLFVERNNFRDFNHFLEHSFRNPTKGVFGSLHYSKIVNCYTELFPEADLRVLLYEMLVEDPTSFFEKFTEYIPLFQKSPEELTAHLGMTKNTPKAGRVYKSKSFTKTLIDRYLIPLKPKKLHLHKHPIGQLLKKFLYGFSVFENRESISYSQEQRKTVEDIFRPTNRDLRQSHDLPLKKYQYPL